MTSLPEIANFVGSTITEAQFKGAISDLRNYLAGLLGTDGTRSLAGAMLGTLGGETQVYSAEYTVVAGDKGKILLCSGTWVLNLSSVSTLGSRFSCGVINYGSGVITINPNASETIDGDLYLDIGPGQSCLLVSSGYGIYTIRGMGSALSMPIVSKTSAYTVVPADAGRMLVCSGSWTLSLTAAATLGDGFVCTVRNNGTGTITLDPAGGETINSAASLALGPAQQCILVCNGVSAFFTASINGVNVQLFSASGTWYKPPFGTMAMIECVGGGGGGGGTAMTSNSAGGGGGGGGYVQRIMPLDDLPSAVVVTVGAGGTCASYASNGTAGGTSSFASYCHALGGGGGGVGNTEYVTGGAGGGNLLYGHGSGGTGANEDADNGGGALYGGGGGGRYGGAGGDSVYAGNGGGPGAAGSAPGGGGGGGGSNYTAGDAGAHGQVTITVW